MRGTPLAARHHEHWRLCWGMFLLGPDLQLCFCTWGLDVIRKEAWPFYRTISGVRLCWELEDSKGPKGLSPHSFATVPFLQVLQVPRAPNIVGHWCSAKWLCVPWITSRHPVQRTARPPEDFSCSQHSRTGGHSYWFCRIAMIPLGSSNPMHRIAAKWLKDILNLAWSSPKEAHAHIANRAQHPYFAISAIEFHKFRRLGKALVQTVYQTSGKILKCPECTGNYSIFGWSSCSCPRLCPLQNLHWAWSH